jgi:hypothetical protein
MNSWSTIHHISWRHSFLTFLKFCRPNCAWSLLTENTKQDLRCSQRLLWRLYSSENTNFVCARGFGSRTHNHTVTANIKKMQNTSLISPKLTIFMKIVSYRNLFQIRAINSNKIYNTRICYIPAPFLWWEVFEASGKLWFELYYGTNWPKGHNDSEYVLGTHSFQMSTETHTILNLLVVYFSTSKQMPG